MIDPLSAQGRKIKQMLADLTDARLKSLQRNGLDHSETQFLRGQIKGYKTVADELFPTSEDT